MELGEAIAPPDFVSNELHNESTCPWHEQPDEPPKPTIMGETDDKDDDPDSMPKNNGGKLGESMGEKGDDSVELKFLESGTIWFTRKGRKKGRKKAGDKRKYVQVIKPSSASHPYPLQFAPHHLIPGDASLKGSAVVPFLGDEDVIKNFSGAEASQIKKGCSVGYNVNDAANGEWLPSPYALSMGNGKRWASDDSLSVLAAKLGDEAKEHVKAFKKAYAFAAMEDTGRQFHFNHGPYSTEANATLDKIAEKLKKIVEPSKEPICEYASKASDDDRLNPPYGLKGRLNILSNNLRRLVTGEVWCEPFFTDGVVEDYLLALEPEDEGHRPEAEIEKIL